MTTANLDTFHQTSEAAFANFLRRVAADCDSNVAQTGSRYAQGRADAFKSVLEAMPNFGLTTEAPATIGENPVATQDCSQAYQHFIYQQEEPNHA